MIKSPRLSSTLAALAVGCLFALGVAPLAANDESTAAEWASLAGRDYRIQHDIVYKVANGYEAKLDVYYPRNADGPRPTVVYIHGDADTVVPYVHATRLHKALEGVGVANELLTIPGAGHGGFNAKQTLKIQRTISRFLKKHGVVAAH